MPAGIKSAAPWTKLSSAILFPLHERLKGHDSVVLRKELEQTQWWSGERLQALQVDRLRRFLVAAGRSVPYYRELFGSIGFDPASVDGVAGLQALPRLDKATIRANTDRLVSETAGPVARLNTGGSSGEPLVFLVGRGRVSHDVAAKWRATRWWGVDIGDPEIVLWGSPIELGKQDRIKALRDRVFRTRLLPAFQMAPEQMDGHLATIARVRPRMLFGYASALALLAAHAHRQSRDMGRLGIEVVFATGETLYPDQREVIERVFAAPVANGYGSRDAGFIAHQCPQGSLHVSAEHIVVELLDESGRPVPPGEPGEIVTTHLATHDFPFVRYRTGDVGILATGPCRCGRGLPVMREVSGRSTDFIVTPTGGTMHALALIYEVRDKPGVQAFKFLQQQDCSVELDLVAGPELTPAVEEAIRGGVLARLGPGARFTLRRVTEIPPEKSGKYRYVVSRARVPSATTASTV